MNANENLNQQVKIVISKNFKFKHFHFSSKMPYFDLLNGKGLNMQHYQFKVFSLHVFKASYMSSHVLLNLSNKLVK